VARDAHGTDRCSARAAGGVCAGAGQFRCVLARSADWFLATALARRGKINGTLSAVQDGWVRGYASATGPDAFGDHEAALAALLDAMPVLAVRRSAGPRSDAERQPDLGAIARAAWFTPMPTSSTPSSDGAGHRLFPFASGDAAVCSPVARLRMAPMLGTAHGVAAGFVSPRVDRAMRRWARTADASTLGAEAGLVRLGLLGGPVDRHVLDAARARWTESAWRALPCLTTRSPGDN
jgi:hypothetical protein